MVNYSCESLDVHKGIPPVGGVMYSCEALEMSPGEEGLWRRLTYEFTRDFKCAENLQEFIGRLRKLDKEGSDDLENTEIDFCMLDKKVIEKLLAYVNEMIPWCIKTAEAADRLCDNDGFLKKAALGPEKIKAFLKKECNKIRQKYDLDKYEELAHGNDAQGKSLTKGKTVKELGFSKSDVVALATKFKQNASGMLANIKKLRGKMLALQTKVINTGYSTIYITDLGMVASSIVPDTAYAAYKRIDYFLYYLSKEI